MLDPSVCLTSGVRYYVDITFENPDPFCSSHILIDSVSCFFLIFPPPFIDHSQNENKLGYKP